MSYTTDIKNTLAKLKTDEHELDFAELYGFVYSGVSLVFVGHGDFKLRFYAKTAPVASRIYTLIKNIFGYSSEIIYTDSASFGKTREYSVTVDDSEVSVDILMNFEMLNSDGTLNTTREISRDLLHDDREYYAFLRGVFITTAAVNDPVKSFSLEFRFINSFIAEEILAYLSDLEIKAKIRENKNGIIVYIRQAEDISAVLAMCGAIKYALEIQSRIASKDMTNRTNRMLNFETANLNKTVDAALKQREAIEKIIRTRGLNSLSEPLIHAAQLRLDNPEASLSELADITGISRSTLDKRMRKIISISKGIQ